MRETVSVVIPARDAAATLERCLAALAAQTRPPNEIVVVDNDSRDRTAGVAITWGERNRAIPVRVIAAYGRRGPGPVRNVGARAAKGSVLAFTDADCVPRPDWLAALLAPLERDAGTVAAAGTVANEGGHGAMAVLQDLLHPPYEVGGEYRTFTRLSDAVVTGSLAVRASAFARAGGFDESLRWLEDIAFPATLLARTGGTIVRTPEAVVAHRAPESVRGALSRAWKYGLASATLFRALWKRKTLVEVTRHLRVDTSALPGRLWISASPDKVLLVFLAPGLLWPAAALLALVPLAYYAVDLRRRASRRGRALGLGETAGLLALDVVYHSVQTAGRVCGSPRGRSVCL